MNRPKRKSTSALSYRENRDYEDSNRSRRRSMRKTIGSDSNVQERKTRKSTTRKSTIKESSESEEDSPIEISDSDNSFKSSKSVEKSTEINNAEDSPKKLKLAPRTRTPSLKALESITTENSPTVNAIEASSVRKSSRFRTPSSKYQSEEFETSPKKRERKSKNDTTESLEEEPEILDKENYKRPTNLFEEGIDVDGKSLFGFRTPGKKGAMYEYAANTPKSHKKVEEYESKTPKSGRKSLVNPQTPKTPKSGRKSLADLDTPKSSRNLMNLNRTPRYLNSPARKLDMQATPKADRERNRRTLKKKTTLLENDSDGEDFSASGSDYSPDESSEDTEDEKQSEKSTSEGEGEKEVPKKNQTATARLLKTPSSKQTHQAPKDSGVRRSQRVKSNYNFVLKSDEYFSTISTKNKTSNHTLDRLKTPRLNHEKLHDLLSKMVVSEEHQKSIQLLNSDHKTLFNKWITHLEEGYSILLHGLGSKRNLLQDFHKKKLADQHVIVVNGFFPDLTVKEILSSITEGILEISANNSNLHEIIDLIENEMKEYPGLHIFLIIHNLEGNMLRNERAQNVLSRLAALRNVHLIASIDHINTPMLWDHTKLSNYNFSWWDVTTMLPYTEETTFENSLMVENSGSLELSSLKHVYASLNSNAKGIYNLIVKYQLKYGNNPNYSGMSFKELYSSCREGFFTSSVLAMRAQLTEFLDHKLARMKRDVAGSEYVTIPIKNNLLEQFLNEQQ